MTLEGLMQPQPDASIVSRPPDGAGRDPTSRWAHRSTPTTPHLPAVLTGLSATVCQIRALQQLHAHDTEVQNRLCRIATDLESLISDLLHTNGSTTSPSPQRTVSTPRQRAGEHAFLGWLADPASTHELTLAGAHGPEPLAQILGELSLSSRVLPDQAATSLGLPPRTTTVGQAAVEVLLAVKDPAGPRCRSFRAAVLYLHALDRDGIASPGVEKVVP
jgi:hypothetical protein